MTSTLLEFGKLYKLKNIGVDYICGFYVVKNEKKEYKRPSWDYSNIFHRQTSSVMFDYRFVFIEKAWQLSQYYYYVFWCVDLAQFWVIIDWHEMIELI